MLNTGNCSEKAKRLLSTKSVVLAWISSQWLIVIIPALERLITTTSSYSDNSCTGKVNHNNFKLGKILQSMTDSPEFDFIPCVRVHYFHQHPIKMDGSMDRSSHSVTWCRILSWSRVSRIWSRYMNQGVDRPLYYVWQSSLGRKCWICEGAVSRKPVYTMISLVILGYHRLCSKLKPQIMLNWDISSWQFKYACPNLIKDIPG